MVDKALEAEWIVAQSILGEIITNDFSKESYEKWSATNLIWNEKQNKPRISWETWKRYYTENLKKVLSQLKNSTEYKDCSGNINPIQEINEEKEESDAFQDASVEAKETKIDLLLSKEKNPYKCMSIGKHQGHYYFGTMLGEGNEKVPAVVLDNGKVFACWNEKHDNEIKDRFGLNYRFELFDDVVDNLWSNKSIKKFRDGNAKEYSIKELHERIKNKNKELMYHSDERVHSFVACDIISNYFYPLFNAKGRTYFQAEFASGKSRQSLIYQKLSFNSLFASNISAAAFERVIESTGGTLVVDNFDNCNDELKKAILQALEVYYKKGGKNIKAAGQGLDKNKPIAFNGFSPLVINNIIGLPEVTESRCNKIQMLKTDKKNVVDIKIKENDPFWNDTKDDLHILALKNWKTIEENYNNLIVPELVARDLEKTEAVLTIAKTIGEDVYNEILAFLVEINEQQSIRDLNDDWNFILFEKLNELVIGDEKRIQINEITELVAHKIIQSEHSAKSDKLKFSHYAGKVLKNMPLFTKKIVRGYVNYLIKRKDLDNILKIKKYDLYITLPHPTTPNITQHNPTTPNTPNNNNNSNNKEITDKSSCKKGVVGVVGCGSNDGCGSKTTSNFSDEKLIKDGYSTDEIKKIHDEANNESN